MYMDPPHGDIYRSVSRDMGAGQNDRKEKAEYAERDGTCTLHIKPGVGGGQDRGLSSVRQRADERQL